MSIVVASGAVGLYRAMTFSRMIASMILQLFISSRFSPYLSLVVILFFYLNASVGVYDTYNGVRKQLSSYPTRLPAHEFVHVTCPYIICDGCINLHKYNKYVFYIGTFLWCPHCSGRYSVTIGDCETPGMELAPGFWVKNDDGNYYDTRRI